MRKLRKTCHKEVMAKDAGRRKQHKRCDGRRKGHKRRNKIKTMFKTQQDKNTSRKTCHKMEMRTDVDKNNF